MAEGYAGPGVGSLDLYGHQRHFIDAVMLQVSPRRVVMIAPPGAGKTIGTIECLARLLRLRSAPHRALVVTPYRALVSQWIGRLEQLLPDPVFDVTPPLYRSMQADSREGENPWDREGVFVTTTQFLRYGSRAEEVSSIRWDIVILEDLEGSLSPYSPFRPYVESLWKSDTAVDLIATLTVDAVPPFIAEDPRTSVHRWGLEDMRRDLVTVLPPSRVVQLVHITLSNEERAFVDRLSKALRMPTASLIEDNYWSLVRRQTESSIPGVEAMLRRAASARESVSTTRELLRAEVELAEDEGSTSPGQHLRPADDWRHTLPFSREDLAELFALLEQINDSKWSKCRELVGSLISQGDQSIVIFTSFGATAEYLASLSELAGWPTYLVTGRSSPEERLGALDIARMDPGVVITTNSGAEGLTLPFISHVFHYDLPVSPLQFLQRVGCVERIGRTLDRVHHYFFVDDTIQSPERVSNFLHNSFGEELAADSFRLG